MAKKRLIRGYRTIPVELKSGVVPVRASPRVADALTELAGDMNLYQGTKLKQVLEAVYEQGRKDGARAVFDRLDATVDEMKKEIRRRPPGRPKGR